MYLHGRGAFVILPLPLSHLLGLTPLRPGSIMAGLLSLPVELLVTVFISSSIRSAVVLSGANRQLHAIWVEHSSHIVPSILLPKITAYENAVSLAIFEETRSKNTRLALPASERAVLMESNSAYASRKPPTIPYAHSRSCARSNVSMPAFS